MSVGNNTYVQVQFEQTVQTIAISDNNFLYADHLFVVCLNPDTVVRLRVVSDVTCILTVLVDQNRVLVHHCDHKAI